MKLPEDAISTAPAVEVEDIPDKLYFRIGEVARLAGIKPYVLRFWETEFSGLGPKKSGTGHRLYRRKDVELVLEIKRLLYEQRYTIEGARKCLEGESRQQTAHREPEGTADVHLQHGVQGELFTGLALDEIKKGLTEILDILKP